MINQRSRLATAEKPVRLLDDSITVVHVDDNDSLVELSAELLEGETDRLTVHPATEPDEALEHTIDSDVDCIVSDYEMPGMDGLELLKKIREEYPQLPFILFTGKGNEEIASEAITAGVTDYLQKSAGTDQYHVLSNRIINSVEHYRAKQVRRLFEAAVEHAGHSIYITDKNGVIEYVNPAFEEITGYSAQEAVGRTPNILKSGEHDESFYADLWKTILDGNVWQNDLVNQRKSGELYVVNQTVAPILDEDGQPWKFVAVNQERRNE